METTELTFEEALVKLEAITKALENGSISLDESLSSFEEGINLIRRCNALLDDAEEKIKILTRSESGDVVEVDFPRE